MFSRGKLAATAVMLATLAVAGCSGKGKGKVELTGGGATFPEPLYKKWFANFEDKHSNVIVEYQGLGSGAGIAQFTQGNLLFGASDAAMNDKELEQAKKSVGDVLVLPLTAGSIVLAYNLPGVEELQLSREVLAGIFTGDITSWNDEKIKAANPNARLPKESITVVVRADSSGTSYVFSTHLEAVTGGDVKASKQPKWTRKGSFRAEEGNSGVTARIKQTEGAIGYIEYGYASQNKLPMASVQNQAKQYIKPTPESGKATLAAGKLPDDFRLFFKDPEGSAAYPIVSYTWLLVRQEYDDAKVSGRIKDLIRYCLSEDAQKMSVDEGYIPLPKEVVDRVLKKVDSIKP